MSADLHIHAVPKWWDTEHVQLVLAVNSSHTLGSKWSTLYHTIGLTPEAIDLNERLSDQEKTELKSELAGTELDEKERELVRGMVALEMTPFWRLIEAGARQAIDETPRVWIGEVSWLKAGLFDDAATFVPGPVERVSSLIGESLPVLTPELKEQLLEALGLPNETSYDVASAASPEVRAFLDAHEGERLFTISW